MSALLLAGAVLLAAGVLLDPSVGVLTVTNPERARAFEIALPADGRFAVTYHHSIYTAPITEEFVARGDQAIRLVSLRSPSAAVLEYFGVTAAGFAHPREARFSAIEMRVAMGTEQTLRVGVREYSFLEFGAHGDRIVLEHRSTLGCRLMPRGAGTIRQ